MTTTTYIPGMGIWEDGDAYSPGEWIAEECPCCGQLREIGSMCDDGACFDCPEWTPEWAEAQREAPE